MPQLLFRGDYLGSGPIELWSNWDVLPDGQRFVLIRDFSQPRPTVTLIQNWFSELKR
jgi:hypothetical protein